MSTDNLDLGTGAGQDSGMGFTPEEMLADVDRLITRLDAAAAAKQPLKDAMEVDDEQMEAMYAIAFMSYTLRRYDQAQMMFSCLFALDPKDPRFSFGFGSCLKIAESYDDALIMFILAMSADIESPKYAYHAAEACWMTGDKDTTIEFLESCLARVDGDPAEAHYLEKAQTMLDNIKSGAVPPKRKAPKGSGDDPAAGAPPDTPPPPAMGGGGRGRMRV